MRRVHIDIGEVPQGNPIGHHPGEADLSALGAVEAEAAPRGVDLQEDVLSGSPGCQYAWVVRKATMLFRSSRMTSSSSW